MSDRGARVTGSVVALEPKANVRPEARDPLEKAGHLILEMIGPTMRGSRTVPPPMSGTPQRRQ
jgi:hypothetical protein